MVAVVFGVGAVMCAVGWMGCMVGQILWLVERSGVRRGWTKAATAGLLLASDRACVTDDGALHQKRLELDQALARWTNPETLLFAPTSNYYHAFALDWFGRAHRTENEVLLEARLSVGQTITLAGGLVIAVGMVLMTVVGGAFLALLVILPIGLLCVRGYRRSFRNEKWLSKHILGEVRSKLERLA
jgi:hypothetical protein